MYKITAIRRGLSNSHKKIVFKKDLNTSLESLKKSILEVVEGFEVESEKERYRTQLKERIFESKETDNLNVRTFGWELYVEEMNIS